MVRGYWWGSRKRLIGKDDRTYAGEGSAVYDGYWCTRDSEAIKPGPIIASATLQFKRPRLISLSASFTRTDKQHYYQRHKNPGETTAECQEQKLTGVHKTI